MGATMWAQGCGRKDLGATIFLDESGCLGWKLDAPYQRGGSSRFFTLAAAIIPDGAEPVLERVVRGVYKHRGRSSGNELKSVQLSSGERMAFAGELAKIRAKRPDIRFVTITVRKERVNGAFRRTPNGLYTTSWRSCCCSTSWVNTIPCALSLMRAH
ncbi:DUF3800 domain-containing protein [Paraburkholderia sp. J63]|uniref:DUF3800 domain-containing protein n=1 Tax=Paraburkholderia sp. J63 TaxID=2805434 RepID=UPI002ABE9B28|nr:DUF3800 domain-containing protein [Paraburkholderia sp. J63]